MSIRRHTAYNLVGAVLPFALSLFTVPLYMKTIGEARYGVLAIAWLLLGYFGLFDLGLGRATAQRIAAMGNGTSAERAPIFWTALAMNGALGAVGGLLIWPAALLFFGRAFNVEASLRPELATAMPWLILAVPLATLSGVLSGALEGRARFLELNVISVAGAALIQLVPLSVARLHGADLGWLMPAVILTRLVTLAALFAGCRRHVFGHHAPRVSWALGTALLRFGGWVTVTALVGPLMVVLDRFVIGVTVGARAVTDYTVPFQLGDRTSVLPAALSSALFPRLASAADTDARQLAATALQSLTSVMTPVILSGLLLLGPFLSWWLDPHFAARAGLTGQILLLGFWINALARVPYAQLQAAGRPGVVARCHLGELLPYLVVLYAGLRGWGLPGAAAAFSVRAFTDCGLLLAFAGSLRLAWRALRMPVVLLMAGFGVAVGLPAGSVAWWMAALIVQGITLVWAWHHSPEAARTLAQQLVLRLPVAARWLTR